MVFRVPNAEFRHAYSVNGTDIFEAEEMLDGGLWDHSLLDGCGAGSLYLPIGPWAKCTQNPTFTCVILP
jgi:hypothetical protein